MRDEAGPTRPSFLSGYTYDALKFIDNEATGDTLYQNWEDVIEVPG